MIFHEGTATRGEPTISSTISAGDGVSSSIYISGDQGMVAWMVLVWTTEQNSKLTFQLSKDGQTWYDYIKSDGSINNQTLPHVGKVMVRSKTYYRFQVKTADFGAQDSVVIEMW